MRIEEICSRLIDDVDGLRACAVVDLGTGLGLAEASRAGTDAGVALSATQLALELFRGKITRQFAGAMSAAVEDFMREVHVTATDHQKFMSAVPGWSDLVLIFVVDQDVSVGLGWMVLHQACGRIVDAADAPQGDGAGMDRASSEPGGGAEAMPAVPGDAEPEANESVAGDVALTPSAAVGRSPRRDGSQPQEPRVEPSRVRPGPRALFRS